jgi:WD40 repeat protein
MRAISKTFLPLLLLATVIGIGLERPLAGQVQSVRAGHTTTSLADGRVLITGGDADGTAEIYDATTDVTTPVDARMIVSRVQHGSVLLADGTVLIVGGYAAGSESIEQSAEIFDASTSQFSKASGTRIARVLPVLTRRVDGLVVVSGGNPDDTIEFYDPETRTFGLNPTAPFIKTDRDDYAPGETVTFTGRRWQQGKR